jgi:hypothetical protein
MQMGSLICDNDQMHHVADLLISHRNDGTKNWKDDSWGIEKYTGQECPKEIVHVCRVLGRVFEGKEAAPTTALKISRELNPADPWQLDRSLWNLGQSNCNFQFPKCNGCYLKSCCRFAHKHLSEHEV